MEDSSQEQIEENETLQFNDSLTSEEFSLQDFDTEADVLELDFAGLQKPCHLDTINEEESEVEAEVMSLETVANETEAVDHMAVISNYREITIRLLDTDSQELKASSNRIRFVQLFPTRMLRRKNAFIFRIT